jgi:hypothetical protein
MDLKSGINISDVMDGDEFNFFLGSDLFEKTIKFSPLLAPTHKSTCGIEGEGPSFERDDIPSHLFFLLKKKDVQTFSGEKSSGRQPAHSGTDDNGIASLGFRHLSPLPMKERLQRFLKTEKNYNRFNLGKKLKESFGYSDLCILEYSGWRCLPRLRRG